MASIDCPLAGDLTYGFRAQNSSVRCPRLFLHCRRIQLLDINDDVFSAEAQLPRELTEVIETLDPLG
jgi:23S rRNA-/tRNA-specific pseudouridylate synthase